MRCLPSMQSKEPSSFRYRYSDAISNSRSIESIRRCLSRLSQMLGSLWYRGKVILRKRRLSLIYRPRLDLSFHAFVVSRNLSRVPLSVVTDGTTSLMASALTCSQYRNGLGWPLAFLDYKLLLLVRKRREGLRRVAAQFSDYSVPDFRYLQKSLWLQVGKAALDLLGRTRSVDDLYLKATVLPMGALR